jgi:hypothetical protein
MTTEQPIKDGWANLVDQGPGLPDGYYCKAHADALKVEEDGGLDDFENDDEDEDEE